MYLAKKGDWPSSSYETRFEIDTSLLLFFDLTKILLILPGSCLSLISLLSIGTFSFGYAYEVPTESSLSQLNLKTHELVLRINLGGDKKEINIENEEKSSEE